MTQIEAAKIIIEQEGRCLNVPCSKCPLYDRDIDCNSAGKTSVPDSTMSDPLAVVSAENFLQELDNAK